MSEIMIEVRPERPRFLVGESVRVVTSLRNQGAGGAPVPSWAGPSPFVYRLDAVDPQKPSFELSELGRREVRSKGSPPPLAPLPAYVLGAGQAMSRADDLTDLASQDIPPGAYRLTARLSMDSAVYESAPQRVEVEAALPDLVSSHVSAGSGRLVTLFAQKDALLLREASLTHPEFGVFRRLEPARQPERIAGLAAAVDVEKVAAERWVAWLAQGTLNAFRRAPDAEPMRLRRPVPDFHQLRLAVAEPVLLAPGFQRADGSALFLVVGSASGAPRLLAGAVSGTGAAVRWEAPLPHLPGRTLAGITASGLLRLVWVDPRANGRHLWTAGFSLLDGKGAAPHELGELAAPLLAWSADEAYLYALCGPAPDGHTSAFRFPFESHLGIPSRFVLPPLSSPAHAWSVVSLPSGELVVGAATEHRLFLLRAPRPATWEVAEEPFRQERLLWLFPDADGHVWAQWVEPGHGFRVLQLTGSRPRY
ncbi:MAG: hypothetical protein ABSH05_26665 [Bryobacteraceae bacterium]